MSLFFHIFKAQQSPMNCVQGQGLITLMRVTYYFKAYSDSVKHFEDQYCLGTHLNEEARVNVCAIETELKY